MIVHFVFFLECADFHFPIENYAKKEERNGHESDYQFGLDISRQQSVFAYIEQKQCCRYKTPENEKRFFHPNKAKKKRFISFKDWIDPIKPKK